MITSLARLKELTAKLEKSERKESLLALRLKTALSAAGAGVWDWELNTDTLRWDNKMVELFDYRDSDFKQDEEGWFLCNYKHFINKVHPEDRDRVELNISNCIAGHTPYRISYRVVVTGNREFTVIQAAGDVFNSRTGKPERLVGVCLKLEGDPEDA